jgi:uncharacterized coiled-coil protein SlyX
MGIQEPSPRPQASKRGPASVWWIAPFLIAVGLWVWIDRRAEPDPEVGTGSVSMGEVQPVVTDPDTVEQVIHLQEMLRRAERELADQREEVEILERQLASAQSESDRNQQGLERAVAELNRINEQLIQLQAATLVPPPRSLPAPPVEQVGPLGAPHVTTHQFGYVVASGLVYNPTDYPARGTLEVSIVGSAGVIDTRGFSMTIAPGGRERYDITFTNVFPTERLGAQARWVP